MVHAQDLAFCIHEEGALGDLLEHGGVGFRETGIEGDLPDIVEQARKEGGFGLAMALGQDADPLGGEAHGHAVLP